MRRITKIFSELEKDKEVFDKLEDIRNNIITKLGENIIIRRFEVIDIRDIYISGYTHNGKIGAYVVLANEDTEIAKDILLFSQIIFKSLKNFTNCG